MLNKSKNFGVRIIKLSRYLDERKLFSIANQVLRCGTSIGANAHEAQDAQSKKDFVSKMSIALKEARETEYWLEILVGSETVPEAQLHDLRNELDEIISLLVSIIKTTKTKYINEL